MAIMGKYCKAYLLSQFQQFSQWTENLENAQTEKQQSNGQETTVRRALTENDVLYLQENYVVTDGIFKDEHIVFDRVTPEWQEFCHTVLQFEPVYTTIGGNES